MKRIWADFNTLADDRVSLSTYGSRESLRETPVEPGEWILITDDDIQVAALVEQVGKRLMAKPAWETQEDVVDDDSVDDEHRQKAMDWLRRNIGQDTRDYQTLLEMLPYAEPLITAKGGADYLRSRAAEHYGYLHLALAFMERALAADPDDPKLVQRRLIVLKEIDLDQAVHEFAPYQEQDDLSIFLVAAGVQIITDDLKRLSGEDREKRKQDLLALTENHYSKPSANTAPPSTHALIHVNRGFIFRDLGDTEKAIAEFTDAIQRLPNDSVAYASRGFHTYPSDSSISDLANAVELEFPSYWPSYMLVHHFIKIGKPAPVVMLAQLSLNYGDAPDGARANLLQWLAISNFLLGGPSEKTDELFQAAEELDPSNLHIKHNYKLYLDFVETEQEEVDGFAWQLAEADKQAELAYQGTQYPPPKSQPPDVNEMRQAVG